MGINVWMDHHLLDGLDLSDAAYEGLRPNGKARAFMPRWYALFG
jgi:hypothetical protein